MYVSVRQGMASRAGHSVPGKYIDVFEMSLADWQRQQAINLDGGFEEHCARLKDMADGGSALIIIGGLPGRCGFIITCHRGGRLFSRVLFECGCNGWPVRVNR